MRKVLIERIPTIGMQIEETVLCVDDLLSADEIFLSNSINGLRWVKQFKDRQYENEKSRFIHKKIIVPINNFSS